MFVFLATRNASALADANDILRVDDIKNWLSKNNNPSLQPYLAFAKAFTNMGADETKLRIAKADIEFRRMKEQTNEALRRAWGTKHFLRFLWDDSLRTSVDYLRIVGTWALGWMADYGYRPAKVGWTVLGTIGVFWVIFWLLLRIVAFTPAKKTTIRKIGPTFLFDRLIPVYKLREDNYDIAIFYRLGSGVAAKRITLFGRTVKVVPANSSHQYYAEICLDALKAFGVVLAAFLLAAINALIAK